MPISVRTMWSTNQFKQEECESSQNGKIWHPTGFRQSLIRALALALRSLCSALLCVTASFLPSFLHGYKMIAAGPGLTALLCSIQRMKIPCPLTMQQKCSVPTDYNASGHVPTSEAITGAGLCPHWLWPRWPRDAETLST